MIVAARRLFAVLTLLSVLVGTAGWAHPACTTPPANHAAASAMDTSHGAPPHATHGACDDTGGDGGAGRTNGGDQTDHRSAPPGGCATVTHCVFTAPAPTATAHNRSVVVSDPPRTGRETLPRGPALEPESPPPRA